MHQNSESIYQLRKATNQISYRYRALLGTISGGHKSPRGGSYPTYKFGNPGAPRWNHPIASPLTRPHMRSLMCGPEHTTGRTPSGRHIPGVERRTRPLTRPGTGGAYEAPDGLESRWTLWFPRRAITPPREGISLMIPLNNPPGISLTIPAVVRISLTIPAVVRVRVTRSLRFKFRVG
jgi:hypothetical protein